MGLDESNKVDALGIDKNSHEAILTIVDSWDWEEESDHLHALQEKINSYFAFIESKEIFDSYPDAINKPLAIEVIGKHPISEAGGNLLEQANKVGSQIEVKVRFRYYDK